MSDFARDLEAFAESLDHAEAFRQLWALFDEMQYVDKLPRDCKFPIKRVKATFVHFRRTMFKDFQSKNRAGNVKKLPVKMAQVFKLFEEQPKIRPGELKAWCEKNKLPLAEVEFDLAWLNKSKDGIITLESDDDEDMQGGQAGPSNSGAVNKK